MVFQPGSDQYPGIGSTAQLLRAYAALEAAGAYDTAVAVNTVGMSRVTLWGEYTRGAANGAVDLLIEISPWQAVNAPGGAVSEWYPMGMLELDGVAAGVDATNLIQRGIITYTSIDATRDSFTIDLSLPSYIERIRVSVRESGVVGTPGSFGLYATLSIVEGPDDGLMLTSQSEVTAVVSPNPLPISSEGITISQTPTVTAGAYAANDAVGGLLTFANAARESGGGGVVKDVIILDDAGQDAAMELWLFNATFVAMADNALWAPSEADLRKLVAIISTTDGAWFAAGTPSAARVEVSQRYDLAGTSLFGQLVTRGTPTFAATDDISVVLGLLQD